MSARPQLSNLAGTLPNAATRRAGATAARPINYAKIAVWTGICIVPWLIIAALVRVLGG